ncbi:MAG TPA: Asp-tRNA(Asn)/Glu-tRNA(Gln) amidotransferase subunit GatA [Pirellulaceae bacterium]|nr:Asp-tRNA(Asn)/Glu-tRNA(Gln) amidotransferase subunit GatA [Pirellulaceae bacterium]
MSSQSLTAIALARSIRLGERTASECVKQALQAIDRGNSQLGAFLSVFHEAAAAEAAALDSLPLSSRDKLPLCGVPVAVKDMFCTIGQPTTCGSRMMEHFVPTYEARVVARLRDAGAVVVGKTNLDEFGMGSTGEFSAFSPIQNPWRTGYSPGGSSGGSAAAVAAGWVPAAIGTDTGGSVRQPAAWCGICGLKPTYGSVSRFGMVAFASSLDQAGVFARTARDVELIWLAIAGPDPSDMTSRSGPQVVQAIPPNKKLRIGVAPQIWAGKIAADVERELQQALIAWRQLGHDVIEIAFPHERFAVAAYYVVASCEAASNLARYDGVRFTPRWGNAGDQAETLSAMYSATRGAGFGPEVRRRVLLGTYCLRQGYAEQYYQQACRARRAISADYRQAFEKVDVIVGPTSPTTAVELGAQRDPVEVYLADAFTVSANLAGVPALSIPVGFSADGMPVGAQLIGPPWSEHRLCTLADDYQQLTDFHWRRPPV